MSRDLLKRIIDEVNDPYHDSCISFVLFHDIEKAMESPAKNTLSDEDILRLWAGDTEAIRPILGKNKIIAFARSIMTSCGIES